MMNLVSMLPLISSARGAVFTGRVACSTTIVDPIELRVGGESANGEDGVSLGVGRDMLLLSDALPLSVLLDISSEAEFISCSLCCCTELSISASVASFVDPAVILYLGVGIFGSSVVSVSSSVRVVSGRT